MTPFFLNSCSGSLFAIYWPPAYQPITHAVLHVPAFAEEMNKSRRMVALQARELAEQGYAVLMLDLFGTGDSRGDFGEASWSIWLENIADAVAWLIQQGAQTINLWGLRLGGLLAMDFVSQHPGVVDNLVVWQPILNADSFVTQFLRLRVAAAMMNNAIPQEKTSDLKNQLQQGNAVEVAGYLLNSDLINPLTALKIAPVALKTLKNIVLFEVVMAENTQPNFLNQQFLDELLKFGVHADLITVVGDSFWASQEIATAPALLQATSEYVKQW